ncbi:leucine-rich repeat-containing G-protein coupled receptor 6-like [Mya arenaria]|uniref:leucine-rich repeat-containing G-protein coupled receptor 6-like n=1 Tax=Mya arenaria TaxID=6604 RepID=UPI0022E657A2|nr:leucine-rich repeat-containing G-protein coupled receptor 6-like [Mya arenaria]
MAIQGHSTRIHCLIIYSMTIVSIFNTSANAVCPISSLTNPQAAMKVMFCDNPMWNTDYSYRVLPLMSESIMERGREFVHYLEVEASNSSVWNSISRRTSYLCLFGYNDYDQSSLITAIEVGIIGETCPKLGFLEIRNLNIKNITKNTFKDLNSLAILLLGNNSITYLPKDVFEYLRNIIWISLDGTRIQTISPQHFCICTKLQFLQIRSSNLSNINDMADVQFPEQRCNFKLLSFTLDSNIFLNMTSAIFKHYSMHGVLSIANTSLSELKQDYFNGLENVLFLSLGYNRIKIIPQDVFNATRNSLQGIRLSTTLKI